MKQIKIKQVAVKNYKGIHAIDLPMARIEHDGEARVQILINAHGPLVSDIVAHLTLSLDEARALANRILETAK